MNKKYLRDGRTVDLVMKVTDSETKNVKYLVSNVSEYYDPNYDSDIEFSDENAMYFVDSVFDNPPKQLKNEEIIKLEEKIESLNNQKKEIENNIRVLTENEKQISKKFEKYSQLKYLLDFIDGKVSHYAIKHWSDIEIVDFKDEKCDYDKKELKLLTLFGGSNGNLLWKINQYSDGSGSFHDTVVPCISYEDAVKECQKFLDEETVKGITYGAENYIKSAKKYGLKLPEGYVDQYKQSQRKSKEDAIQSKEKEIQELKKQKEEIE
jgi:hypothetical protein